MKVVIAGDIVGSKKNRPQDYLDIIKPILTECADQGLYQIYRGDSFQALIRKPELALYYCLYLKSALIKQGLDVRIAIGIGTVDLLQKDIAISTGSALTRSGELLDQLKQQDQDIMVKSDHHLDLYMNTALKMALIYINDWTTSGASTVHELFVTPDLTQKELGDKLGIQQATASRRLDRAHWKETQELITLFHNYYKDICHDLIN